MLPESVTQPPLTVNGYSLDAAHSQGQATAEDRGPLELQLDKRLNAREILEVDLSEIVLANHFERVIAKSCQAGEVEQAGDFERHEFGQVRGIESINTERVVSFDVDLQVVRHSVFSQDPFEGDALHVNRPAGLPEFRGVSPIE
jgi:hypothetical protein